MSLIKTYLHTLQSQTQMNYNDFWDNVLKQEEWNDELKRWENTHPEYKPFKEDSNSQRQQNLSN